MGLKDALKTGSSKYRAQDDGFLKFDVHLVKYVRTATLGCYEIF